MKNRKVLLLIAVISLCLIVAIFTLHTTTTVKAQNNHKLIAPQFLTQAQQNSIDSYIGDKLDEEAGISAYYKSPDEITLDLVRDEFRTIEVETDEYIIGSVPVLDYPEHYDVHVYVNTNGWILAYYLREDNVGKILDGYHGTIDSTHLTSVLATVAAAAGAPFTEGTYYDFRYPNATNLIFVFEDADNGRDFTIELPSDYGYFERGWATYNGNLYLDAEYLPPTYTYNGRYYGSISAGQLMPGETHLFEFGYRGAIAIVYRVP